MKVISWFALSSIFISGIYINTKYGVFFFSYVVMSVTYLLAVMRTGLLGFRKSYVVFFTFLLVISFIGFLVSSENYGMAGNRFASILIKIFMLALFVMFFTSIYNMCGKSVKLLFRRYLEVAFFFALLGISQEIIFLLFGFDYITLLSNGSKNYGAYIGIAGLSVEPAFYACALLPAGAYYVSEFTRNFKLSLPTVFIVSAILMSTSSLGYIGLFFSIAITVLFHIKLRHVLVLIITLPLLSFGAYKVSQLDFFKMRMDDTLSVISGAELTMASGMNISTYSLAVNMSMAMRSLVDNYGFGAGFGSYSYVFDYYINDYEIPSYRDDLPGRGSATSLFARLTAELGASAWIFLAMFFLWGLIEIRRSETPAVVISYIATLLIIMLRMGEYYANGVILVFLMIYFLRLEDRTMMMSSRIT